MKPAYLTALNPQQRYAVEYGIGGTNRPGPLLVIAGAGSGKTNTLAHRVAHLVVTGADPRRILLLTFSRRAAADMTRRVKRITAVALGPTASTAAATLAWSGTFHAIGARLLRNYADQIGLNSAFTIHDRGDAADLMNLVRHELGLAKTHARFPTKATCLAIYSRAVNAQAPLEAILAMAFPWCSAWERQLRELYAGYVEAKQRQNVLDYDDLLLYWAQVMAEPTLAADIAARFDHVLVDEYQDTNRLQASILMALKPSGEGLTVVGDDAQAIYSFRAATVRNILDFPHQFSPPATIVTLERNYRSTPPVLAAANAVIAMARERFSKTLWSERLPAGRPRLVTLRDEAEQASYAVDRILENREAGMALKMQAVLFRSSHHSGPVEIELTRRNVPFIKYGGLRFLESAHVKDVVACLRFIENPLDRMAGFRVLQLLPGIGPINAGRALDAFKGRDLAEAVAQFCPPPPTTAAWAAFADLVGQLLARMIEWPAELGLVRAWYEPHLQRIHEDAAIRMADLAQIEQIASGYPSRERFLTELTLDPPDASSDAAGAPRRDEDYLVLSTIHSAKGQEWRAVFLLNAVDGCVPSDLCTGTRDEIEEERRLLYVAMTRARDELELLVPQRFYVHQQANRGDHHVYATRTRFIPATVLPLFDQRTPPAPAVQTETLRPAQPQPRLDIGARLRGMWQ